MRLAIKKRRVDVYVAHTQRRQARQSARTVHGCSLNWLFVFEGVVGGSYRCDWWVVVWVRRCGGGGRGPLMMGAAYSPVMRTSTWLTLPSPVLT